MMSVAVLAGQSMTGTIYHARTRVENHDGQAILCVQVCVSSTNFLSRWLVFDHIMTTHVKNRLTGS